MINTPNEIVKQYNNSQNFKSLMGSRGLFEQTKMNARFYAGDQWYGTAYNSSRPLVRNNIIKRIGEYKMGVLAGGNTEICFAANEKGNLPEFLNEHFKFWSKSKHFEEKTANVLKDSFISGTGVLYTFWQSEENGEADINCEVLDILNVAFGDVTLDDVQKQPYIIVKNYRETESLKNTAIYFGANKDTVNNIKSDYLAGKTAVYTKFYKEKDKNGCVKVKAVVVTENAVIREPFDTNLTLYPICIFAWEKEKNNIFGQSEITNILPNQIAINRLITAQVWASMSMGMPIMTVNGDIITGEISNDPGQIIKVYGAGEDVKDAIQFVTPPDFSENFNQAINALVSNTLENAGGAGALYGSVAYNNTAAINALVKNNDISMKVLKLRYLDFLSEFGFIWLDFCTAYYGNKTFYNKAGEKFLFSKQNCKNTKFSVEVKQNDSE